MRTELPMHRWLTVVLAGVGLIAAGCNPLDPRCEALCVVRESSVSGAFDVCSQESADRCASECTTRLSDVTSLCGTCLIEGARFEAPQQATAGDFCDGSSCTMTGRGGSCTYSPGDDAAHQDCIRKVYPRREVVCTAEYRPVTQCAAVCVAE